MTDSTRTVTMDAIPGMGKMLLRAALTRKKPRMPPQFPAGLRVTAGRITADPARLARFRAVCGYDPGNTLPLPYPHIMAFALHIQLMLEPDFPLAPTGAVHVRNRIRQGRAIRQEEALDFDVRLAGAEQVARGYEVGLITEARVAGELVWEELSVMLIRRGGAGGDKDKRAPAEVRQYADAVRWDLAANMGRQYAAASGDYNPIHLYPWSARLMGFKRQIMHGMWSMSRTVAHLLPGDHTGSVCVNVAFKLPVFLPGTVTLLSTSDDQGSRFEMKDGKGEKPHLTGEIELGPGGER